MNRRRDISPVSGASGTVRIIGGEWRGTRLPVADRVGLRPSADRVRETLFNWLQPKLPDARVLDLFAGTGALGLEALSRGASEAVLIEREPGIAENLRRTTARLQGGDRARVICDDATVWLRGEPSTAFDVVFVDPPFAGDWWRPVLGALSPWLAQDAWLYLESPAERPAETDEHWLLHREGRTRDVHYALYRRWASEGFATSGV
ncbi:MAG: 16S rRNA (guanine(966)-N(2))-methyltransferase RsmD [Lysobacteraceae bacterium]|nr:MAG: 16S rRNA (guanine(966)-N(2))-methyltransferase RsmD [Xanthomonadaceae bacterium]